MDNLRRTVLCKRSRNEKNRIVRKTKGKAKGREKEGRPTDHAAQCRSTIRWIEQIERIPRVKLRKKECAEIENERKERKGVESSESFHAKTRQFNSLLYGKPLRGGRRESRGGANRPKSRAISSRRGPSTDEKTSGLYSLEELKRRRFHAIYHPSDPFRTLLTFLRHSETLLCTESTNSVT